VGTNDEYESAPAGRFAGPAQSPPASAAPRKTTLAIGIAARGDSQ
jgi:hypothetical protein